MKHHVVTIAPFIAAMLLATPALAQAEPPAISVSGEATVSVPPDMAEIDGGFTSEAKTAHEASDASNAAMGKVLLALKAAGIEREGYPDLAAVIAAANTKRAESLRPADHRRLPRQQSRDDPAARCHQGRQRDRHAGGRGRE